MRYTDTERLLGCIARSPFLCLSTQHENGSADVSPRGDAPGFVQVLDNQTLLIPVPTLAIAINVKEAFLHCAKALRRAKLWKADSLQPRSEMKSMIGMIMEQSSGSLPEPETLEAAERSLEDEYNRTMY